MATAPVFASTPKLGTAAISTANTNRDGTGTIGTVLTAGASGTKINEIRIEASAATTAGIVRLFIFDGTNTRLFYEQLVAAITPSASVKVFESTLLFDNLVLPTGHQLRASTHNAEAFNVFALGADL